MTDAVSGESSFSHARRLFMPPARRLRPRRPGLGDIKARDLQAAMKFARQVAERANVGAWVWEGKVEFRKIPSGKPPGQ